ncbi:unnamed protein product [Arabidopsis lyrata]|uniref:Uncharacterized protein n=1 Tax=Arabidopsis lyrata subsp. lyrata TaxID=81972 RepID=D7MIB3_ARALL|nr:hypothetical protein ARALYDRAFT_915861 [Arabidopsis lyrata subsp. lyrata]EFH46785.1 hypothetical protein ARALYDRAFT_915867 [Arabidopsis lyrata subsp. lyrata]CAH8277255.1 unnamed protein product [Arabidopsis lyrata]
MFTAIISLDFLLDTNSNNFQHPCVSNKEHYSVVQESVNNSALNQLMQIKELYGYDQNNM